MAQPTRQRPLRAHPPPPLKSSSHADRQHSACARRSRIASRRSPARGRSRGCTSSSSSTCSSGPTCMTTRAPSSRMSTTIIRRTSASEDGRGRGASPSCSRALSFSHPDARGSFYEGNLTPIQLLVDLVRHLFSPRSFAEPPSPAHAHEPAPRRKPAATRRTTRCCVSSSPCDSAAG